MLHRVFEAGSNRRPAGETLERVGRALKGDTLSVVQTGSVVYFCLFVLCRLTVFVGRHRHVAWHGGSSRRLMTRLGASSSKVYLV